MAPRDDQPRALRGPDDPALVPLHHRHEHARCAFDGVWVDNITVNGAAVGDGTLAGWKSLTELNPVKVNGFTVQLVGIDQNKKTPTVLAIVPVGPTFEASVSGGKVRSLIGTQAELTGAIVTYDEPTESINAYARYSLWANGVLQPGG